MDKINVGVNGVSGLVAQVDSPLVLSEWFESNESRVFVVKFSDYCAYMATYGRSGYNNLLFARAHRIIECIVQDNLDITKKDADEVLSACFYSLIKDVGCLLLKAVSLYSRGDSDWKCFNIEISMPLS